MDKLIVLDGNSLTLEEFIAIVRQKAITQAGTESIEKMTQSYEYVRELYSSNTDEDVYGLNTGLGSLLREHLSVEELVKFSRNVVLSHACGVGEPFDEEVVRGAMLLLVNNHLSGYSGIRPVVPSTIIEMLNKSVHPVVPSQGSLGASGDLAPLAHLALVVTRDPNKDEEKNSGLASYNEEQLTGYSAMKAAEIDRIILGAKEGLSIVNGTHFTTSLLALAIWDCEIIAKSVDIISTMSLEALRSFSTAFDEKIHNLRPYQGQMNSASNIRNIFAGSTLMDSTSGVIQDPYAFRCTPQVHGAFRNALKYASDTVKIELNAVTDSPLVFPDSETILSGGNFHAEPLGYAADTLGMALTGLGTLVERRAYRLLDGALNRGLPSFLIQDPGLNTGFMIAQYTAASLASENKVLSHPSTIDSITSSENQEDHVSMATTATRKLRTILENVTKIMAIELMFAAQALDLRRKESELPNTIGVGTSAALEEVRKIVTFATEDRVLSQDINLLSDYIKSGNLIEVVEKALDIKLL